jgi:hypothetical protein
LSSIHIRQRCTLQVLLGYTHFSLLSLQPHRLRDCIAGKPGSQRRALIVLRSQPSYIAYGPSLKRFIG